MNTGEALQHPFITGNSNPSIMYGVPIAAAAAADGPTSISPESARNILNS